MCFQMFSFDSYLTLTDVQNVFYDSGEIIIVLTSFFKGRAS